MISQIFYILHWIKNLSMFEKVMMMMMMIMEVKVLVVAVKMTIQDNKVFR